MTTDTFHCLYYTDCRPGQGLRGGAGFQFQSVSAGVQHDEMNLVQRSALYEAPASWMREHRPVADYPPSLAHVFDGVYATARGVYLGAEANGVREGNQFTHAVTTADPAVYGPVRPAQLWNAPWWSEQPADRTDCDPVDGLPERGPWGVDAVREWVLGRPDSLDWLIAVSSAFDRLRADGGRRVVFVAEDPTSILGWITAGTLLLPQARALRLSFRVFSNNPQYAEHDILGLHPDWAGSLATPARGQDFLVFNVDSARHAAVEPTESAAFWASCFLDDDPFDVVDAVELAHEFAGRRLGGGDPAVVRATEGDRLASAIVTLDKPMTEAAQANALADWLDGQAAPVDEDLLATMTAALLAGPTDATGLRRLDAVLRRYGALTESLQQARLALFSAELTDAVGGRREPAGTLPAHRWTPEARKAAAALAERTATEVPPERMDPVLRTAMRFAVPIPILEMRDTIHRFVTWWADHPGAGLDPGRWPSGQLLVDQLSDELRQRPEEMVDGPADQLWRVLLPVTDLDSWLDIRVAAAAMAKGDRPVREQVSGAVLDITATSTRPDAGDRAWHALSFPAVAPSPAQLVELLSRLRRGTSTAAFGQIAGEALSAACRRGVGRTELRGLELLEELGHRLTDPGLVDLRAQDRNVRRWLGSASTANARLLVGVTGPVLEIYREDVLNTLVDLPLDKAIATVRAVDAQLHQYLLDGLYPFWSGRRVRPGGAECVAVAVTFALTDDQRLSTMLADKYGMRLRNWVKKAPQSLPKDVLRRLDALEPRLGDNWIELTGRSPDHAASAAGKRGRRQDKPPGGQRDAGHVGYRPGGTVAADDPPETGRSGADAEEQQGLRSWLGNLRHRRGGE